MVGWSFFTHFLFTQKNYTKTKWRQKKKTGTVHHQCVLCGEHLLGPARASQWLVLPKSAEGRRLSSHARHRQHRRFEGRSEGQDDVNDACATSQGFRPQPRHVYMGGTNTNVSPHHAEHRGYCLPCALLKNSIFPIPNLLQT